MAIFEEFNQASIVKLLSLHGGRPTGVIAQRTGAMPLGTQLLFIGTLYILIYLL